MLLICIHVRRLAGERERFDVIVYDKLTYASRLENLHDILDRVRFIRGDVANEELLEHVLRGFEPELVVTSLLRRMSIDRLMNHRHSSIQIHWEYSQC